MTFWTAIVAIVFIGSASGVLKEALKRRKVSSGGRDVSKALAEQRAVIDALRTELDALKSKVDEQEVFVDEAISQFRPRLDTLRSRRGNESMREGDQTSEPHAE